MKQRTRSKRSIGGFTLIEMLVVIIIIGVLFAIAAPGWDTLLSRQRVNAAREQVAQTIRVAQSEARRTRAPRIVVFDPGTTTGKPRVATAPYLPNTTLPVTNTTIATWVLLDNGDVNANTLQLATNEGSGRTTSANKAIVFDGNGTIAQVPTVANAQSLPFVISISRGNTTNKATARCVVVDTLLGATRSEEGAYNSSTQKGCLP
jgi:prepilin-type N-terminal cleavage/methylation domain-containing protein